MTTVSEGFDEIVRAHRAMGSPLPDFLNPGVAGPAQSDSVDLSELEQLYGQADGVDMPRWQAAYPGRTADLLPGWEFPSRQYAGELAAELRAIRPLVTYADEPEFEILGETWQLVFTNFMTGDEHIAFDAGSLMVVRLPEETEGLDYGLGELLRRGADRFVELGARWSPADQMIEWDYDREESLPLFP